MYYILCALCFFFRQKTAYEMRISDWSSDVCSSDLCKSTLPPTLRRWPLGTSSTLQLARRLCRLPPLHHLAGQGQTSGDRRRHSRQETRHFVGKRLVVGLAGAFKRHGSSEERRVGKECVSTCHSRGLPAH